MTFGHVSGAHINPAVTIPMMITKKIGIADGIGYILFQIIGAVVATASLATLFPEIGKMLWGAHGGSSELLNNKLSMFKGLAVEIILTFFLVTVIFMTAVHKKAPKSAYGAVIGGMVFITLVGVPLTGASMNPARSFSPALISGDSGLWEVQWLYWVGPIVGGIIAGLIMNYVYVNKAEKEA